tara:strand:+ start:1084 stop:1623 length:540 start_codon:yes stop_codon:yes gene_type:complete
MAKRKTTLKKKVSKRQTRKFSKKGGKKGGRKSMKKPASKQRKIKLGGQGNMEDEITKIKKKLEACNQYKKLPEFVYEHTILKTKNGGRDYIKHNFFVTARDDDLVISMKPDNIFGGKTEEIILKPESEGGSTYNLTIENARAILKFLRTISKDDLAVNAFMKNVTDAFKLDNDSLYKDP